MEEFIVSGYVGDVIFRNEENGYTVFSVETSDETIVCVGEAFHINEGESVKATGVWTTHPVYGRQLKISYIEKSMPEDVEGIEKYLSSGVIKGVGVKMAKKIAQAFGEATFDIIDADPVRLSEIRGISVKKAIEIGNIFHEQQGMRNAMLFFGKLGISSHYAIKIYKKYREEAIYAVKTNPYGIADEIWGIGFKTADRIAAMSGILPNSPYRIKAGIKYVLNFAASSGHTFLPRKSLLSETSRLLELDEETIEAIFPELQIEREIIQEKINDIDAVYLSYYYYAELSVAKNLMSISNEGFDIDTSFVFEDIKRAEAASGIALAENQKKAALASAQNGLLVITGGPGTGKTTTIKVIINFFLKLGKKIVLAAPTGRAAKRMTESTGLPAQTIHRLLGITYIDNEAKSQSFDKNEDNPIEADVIIIDEMSMVDIFLMNSFLKAVPKGCRLILVGDANQLPSVGPGNVLKDIIKSGKINVVSLDEIFRQAGESAIIVNAHRINTGEYPVFNEKSKDFFFVERLTPKSVTDTIKELLTKRLPNYLSKDGFLDMQVLTPVRKGATGVYSLNSILQEVLNPPSSKKAEKEFKDVIYRIGDKVMQIKNNYNMAWQIRDENGRVIDEGMGVFNGDQGIICGIDDLSEGITVVFDDNKYVEYDYSQLEELELSYAITIHKSQGSEYPVVVMPVLSGPPMLMTRNLLYTAVTRAKELVVLVGSKNTVYQMVDNNKEIRKYSGLDFRIARLYDVMYG
ncbi:MAG: ATP-dependent RecD-like DNA helicase [Lachnospiraceae bacterium]|nr:ATP-dependent RecD-like DNA helicase [Lachnospiraceae bacterium]